MAAMSPTKLPLSPPDTQDDLQVSAILNPLRRILVSNKINHKKIFFDYNQNLNMIK